MPRPYHGGHELFQMVYKPENCQKCDFDPWPKELAVRSVAGKLANLENQKLVSERPWALLETLVGEVTTRSETKAPFEEIGISLHKVASRNSYSILFACRGCNRSTNVLYPLHYEASHRWEADRTMLRTFACYFKALRPSLVSRVGSRTSNLLPSLAPPLPPPVMAHASVPWT